MKQNSLPGHGPGPNIQPELDRKRQFAIRVSVSLRCLDNWIHDRKIPFLKVGRTVLIPWREALETLNRNYRINARGEDRNRREFTSIYPEHVVSALKDEL